MEGFMTQAEFDAFAIRKTNEIGEGQVASRRDTPTAMAGSVEAYRLFLERDQEQARQTEIALRSQEALTDIRAELKSRGLLGVARR